MLNPIYYFKSRHCVFDFNRFGAENEEAGDLKFVKFLLALSFGLLNIEQI